MNTGKITLIGAGPGDPDLLTIKGMKALQSADVVLYDALANHELFKYTPNQCIYINVGKRANQPCPSQEEINHLLVEYAFKYENVVRLKGGDPIVFGRGMEEADYARQFEIEVEIIPGVSSCIAAPALANIPVTKRGIAESFWVITGHTQNGKVSEDLIHASKSNATIVILMGLGHLSEIMDLFLNQKKGDLPVGIIQNGTRRDQNVILGKIKDIESLKSRLVKNMPGVIVIGEVVNHAITAELAEVYFERN
ncbi:MAG: uroporphyrinogen-III C-methyltransferase [Bacteroidetes bacterium]|nr:uroporphyrinogen-III C-methyltransferase [Bacteroidota bacterium]